MGVIGLPVTQSARSRRSILREKKEKKKKKQGNGNSTVEWNVDTTKDQRTGKMCSL